MRITVALFVVFGWCAEILAQESVDERLETLERKVEEQQAQLDALNRQPPAFTIKWQEGLRFTSPDRNFEAKVFGRLLNDWTFVAPDRKLENQVGSLDDGVEFRAARLGVSGTIYEHVTYKVEYDFSGGDADFKDATLGLKGIPYLGTITIGHQKEPFGLEQTGSGRFLTFLERALPEALVPGRNTGVKMSHSVWDGRLGWSAGCFRETDDFGEGRADGDYNTTFRVRGLPFNSADSPRLIHLGFAYSYQNPPEDRVSFDSTPEAADTIDWVDTGPLLADEVQRFGLEGAVVWGRWSLQAEYIHASVELDSSMPGGDPDFHGHYVELSCFLTGESRVYDARQGGFGRVSPRRRFLDGEGGLGAWEVAARYSALDLSNEDINGGEMENFTLGLNWILNPNTVVKWNWIAADRTGGGNADILAVRFQIDF